MNRRFDLFVDRIIYVGVLLSVIIVPLIFNVHNQNIVILKPLLAEFFVFFLFGLWMINSLEKGQFKLPRTALNLPLITYLIWIVCTVLISSMFWFYSIEELGRYLAVFLLFFLVQKTIRNPSRLRWMFWILFGVFFVATGWGMIQKLYNTGFINRPLVDWGREVLVSTFGNKNFFAGFLVLTTPIVFGYILAARKWIFKGILLVLFLAEFYILMATGTRTGFLGFWFGMTILVLLLIRFIWFGSQFQKMRRKKRLATYALIFVALVLITYFIVPGHLIERLGGAFDLQKGTQRVRWVMWTGSSRATVDNPLTGHGHGTFQLVFPNYRPTMYHRFRVSHNTRHSHNEFLEVLMETGIIGLSLFLLLFVVLGVVSYRFIKHCNSRYYTYLVIGLISGLSAALAQNFASVNLRWMSSTFLFWLTVGLLFATIRVACLDSRRQEQASKRRIRGTYRFLPKLSWKTPIHCFIILVVGFVGYGFFRLVQADFYLKELNGMINVAEKTQRVTWDETIETGEKSVRYSPFSLSSRYKLGFAFLQKGNHRRAYQQYDILTDMAPNYAQIHNNIALIHRRFSDPYRSLLHFEWATALEDNIRNHLNLVQRYNKAGIEERALDHALYVPWIGREDERNRFHGVRPSQSPQSISNVLGRIKNIRSQVRPMKSYLARGFADKNPPVSNLFEIWQFVSNSLKQNTLRSVMRLKQRNQFLDNMSMLGIARQLRGRQVSQRRQFYTQMVRQWYRKNSDDPVMALSLAELLAQSGKGQQALELINSHRDQLMDHEIYRDSINYIEKTSS